MKTLTINIKNDDISEKIVWFLKQFNNNELEIIDKEDWHDLKLLLLTRHEESIPFEEYLKNENQN